MVEDERTCACVSLDATECTSIRYNEDRETVRYNGDACQCVCHDQDDYDCDDYDLR
jgi:hypothetical protein